MKYTVSTPALGVVGKFGTQYEAEKFVMNQIAVDSELLAVDGVHPFTSEVEEFTLYYIHDDECKLVNNIDLQISVIRRAINEASMSLQYTTI